MDMMRFLVVALTLCAGSAQAQQAYSKSMAECAGLFAFGADNVSDRGAVRIFEHGQARWIAAAAVQAQAEGVADPKGTVRAQMRAKQDEWQSGGLLIVLSDEFEDWIDYCRAFADAQGIDLDPG